MVFSDTKIKELYGQANGLLNLIQSTHDIEDLHKLYSLIKDNIFLFCNNGRIDSSYQDFIFLIRKAESVFSQRFLVDIGFYLKKDLNINSDSDYISILEYIVNCARRSLILSTGVTLYSDIVYRKKWIIDSTNKCFAISDTVRYICDTLGIKSNILEIKPGFYNHGELFDGGGYHHANVVCLDNKYFLIDVTYSQFFNESRCNIDRLGLMHYALPSNGYFMMLNDSRKNISYKIIKDGYIELDSAVFKDYMDGFALSFRNSLYYRTNDYSYTTEYDTYDYINFLEGHDSQVDREGLDVLGYQKKFNI